MAIQYFLTDVGRDIALNATSLGLNVSLSHIGVGTAKYDPLTELDRTALVAEVERYPLNGGGVEPNSHTLRFVTSIEPTITVDGFEVGIFTDTGALFAIASTTGNDPLIRLVANIVAISSFGMILSTLDLTNLIITVDPNTPICVALMNQHLDHPNPHPQYALNTNVDAMNAYSLLQQHVLDLSGLDPNTYYPVTINITDYKDCKFYIDTPLRTFQSPWATHDSGTFNLYAEWTDRRIGWWENSGLRIIENFDFQFSDKSPIIDIGQVYFNNFVYFFLRGGTKYIIYMEKGLVPVLHNNNYHMEAIGRLGELHTFDLNLKNVNDVSPSMYPDPTLLRKRQHLDDPDPHPQYSLETAVNWLINNLQQQIDANASNNSNSDDYLQNLITALQNNKYDKTGGELNGNILLKGYLELTGGRTVAKLYAADFLRLELNHPLLINDAVNVSNVVAATDLTVSDNGSTSITHSNTEVEGNFVRFSSARDKYVFDKPIHAPNLNMLGVGQSWYDMTSQRAFSEIYTNNTGKPIQVSCAVHGFELVGLDEYVAAKVDTVLVQKDYGHSTNGGYYGTYNFYFIVPAGSTYQIFGKVRDILYWSELR